MASKLRGFTLLEVMVALFIVGLGMAAAITQINQTAYQAIYLREKTLANWIAMNKVSELRLERRWPEIGDSDGEIEYGTRNWHWRTEVTETPVESLRRIDISVAPAETPENVIITLVAFLGPPRPQANIDLLWLALPNDEQGPRQ